MRKEILYQLLFILLKMASCAGRKEAFERQNFTLSYGKYIWSFKQNYQDNYMSVNFTLSCCVYSFLSAESSMFNIFELAQAD